MWATWSSRRSYRFVRRTGLANCSPELIFIYDSPRRTIATAQALYHRFHLYFSKKDFNYFVSPYYLEVEFDKQPDLIGCLPRRSLRFDQDAWHPQKTSRAYGSLLCCQISWASRKVQAPGRRDWSWLYGSSSMLSMWRCRFSSILSPKFHIFGQQVVESDRQRLLAIERLILETICFNFKCRLPFSYVIKIGRQLRG